jgi:hypothetical protein
MPMSLKRPLVVFVSSHTAGAKSRDVNNTKPEMAKARVSAFFSAIRLGSSSPSTSVKYDRIRVITTRAIEDKVVWGIVVPKETSQFVNLPEKLSAAKALLKKPARVITT